MLQPHNAFGKCHALDHDHHDSMQVSIIGLDYDKF